MKLSLELEVGVEAIAGRLREQSGVEHRFQGVLDLLEALNRARRADATSLDAASGEHEAVGTSSGAPPEDPDTRPSGTTGTTNTTRA